MSQRRKMPLSLVSEEFGMIETIINDCKTVFALYKEGIMDYRDSIVLEGEQMYPISEEEKAIKNGFLGLPGRPIKYGSPKELYEDLVEHIKKYFNGKDNFIKIAAMYTMMTWLYDLFEEVPYLRVLGGFQTGKSRFLKAVGSCCYKYMTFNGSSSIPAMFRALDEFRGTLIFDEGDFKASDFANEATKIFNNGYSKGFPVVRAGERGGANKYFEPEYFDVFGPKIISTRQTYDDLALESRCITQQLFTLKEYKNIPKQLPTDAFADETRKLRGKLLRFRFKYYSKLKMEEFNIANIKNLRVLQIMTPIWIISKLISEEAVDLVVEYAKQMDNELSRAQIITDEAEVLVSILQLVNKSKEKIYMKDIAIQLGRTDRTRIEDSPFIENERQYVIGPRKIGYLVEKRLHLKKLRDNNGLYLLVNKSLRNQLAGLKTRFGIDEEEFACNVPT